MGEIVFWVACLDADLGEGGGVISAMVIGGVRADDNLEIGRKKRLLFRDLNQD